MMDMADPAETPKSESTNVDGILERAHAAIEVCKLVVSAAAKQTITAKKIRQGPPTEWPALLPANDRQAVGRLHNAARKARAALPADVVKAIETKAAEDCDE